MKRVAYTENEIALKMLEKMRLNNHKEDTIINKYVDMGITELEVKDMLSGNKHYNLKMMKLASDYLGISFSELTKVIDDNINVSFRKNDEGQDLTPLIRTLDILFTEYIIQDKLNKF